MRSVLKTLVAISISVAPLLAGALMLEVGNPVANPEAKARNAVLVARITACHSPEKTSVTATAEGLVDGNRQSIPLTVIRLSTPGTFAVKHEWPRRGTWAVKMVATNPDYKDYATGILAPGNGDSFEWAAVKRYTHAPTAEDLEAVLGKGSLAASHP